MKRMHLIIVAFVIGLALCGWLTLRHAIRTAVIVPPVSDLPAPTPSVSKLITLKSGGPGRSFSTAPSARRTHSSVHPPLVVT